jgi:hypothetical protein
MKPKRLFWFAVVMMFLLAGGFYVGVRLGEHLAISLP